MTPKLTHGLGNIAQQQEGLRSGALRGAEKGMQPSYRHRISAGQVQSLSMVVSAVRLVLDGY